jgi:hypothetical protein
MVLIAQCFSAELRSPLEEPESRDFDGKYNQVLSRQNILFT